jgi:hypothetical protein
MAAASRGAGPTTKGRLLYQRPATIAYQRPATKGLLGPCFPLAWAQRQGPESLALPSGRPSPLSSPLPWFSCVAARGKGHRGQIRTAGHSCPLAGGHGRSRLALQ